MYTVTVCGWNTLKRLFLPLKTKHLPRNKILISHFLELKLSKQTEQTSDHWLLMMAIQQNLPRMSL